MYAHDAAVTKQKAGLVPCVLVWAICITKLVRRKGKDKDSIMNAGIRGIFIDVSLIVVIAISFLFAVPAGFRWVLTGKPLQPANPVRFYTEDGRELPLNEPMGVEMEVLPRKASLCGNCEPCPKCQKIEFQCLLNVDANSANIIDIDMEGL